MSIPSPYAHGEYRGRPLDFATIAAIKKAEHMLGYPLTIVQGIGGAPASAGTHTKGRAADLAWWDQDRKLRAMRDVGFAYWPRPELPGEWAEHGHGVLIFENRANRRGVAGVAFRQIASYDARRDGLKSNLPDKWEYRPDPRAVWTREEYKFVMSGGLEAPPENRVTRARDALVEALHDLSEVSALLGKTPEEREKVHDALEEINRERRQLRVILEGMPQR